MSFSSTQAKIANRVLILSGCLCMAFVLWRCAPQAPQPKKDALSTCTDAETKPSPFFGPIADKQGQLAAAPEGEFYVVATHMKVRISSQPAMAEFNRVMGQIQKAFPTQQGLLAASLYFSQKCGYAKTLTVWKGYESMMKFVVSDAHSDAMVNAHKIASHFRTTHWKGERAAWPVNWEGASERLATVTIKTYD